MNLISAISPLVLCLAATFLQAASEKNFLSSELAADLSACNIVWNTPSKDSFENMPLSGIRGTGANVWVSEGSLWIYLAHNGAYDESGALLKLGALRLDPVGLDWKEPAAFKQTQDLATGTITVDSTARDGTHLKLRLRFLGETLMIDATASKDVAWEAAFATWRDVPKKAPYTGGLADTVSVVGDALHFIHRNGDTQTEANLARSQNIAPEAMLNLLSNRNFGGALVAKGGLIFSVSVPVSWQTWKGTAWSGKTINAKEQTLAVTLGAGKNTEPAQWESAARELLSVKSRQVAENTEGQRWNELWNRSHIFVAPRGDAKDPAFQIGRNYQLFRQMLACNQNGEIPLKFNGGIFGTESHPERIPSRLNNPGCPTDGASTPDFRRWGHMFLGQNQRWLGWGSVANGDADLVSPTIRFYRDRLAIARARARNLKAEGACYPEALGLDGTICVAPTGQSMCSASHLTYHFCMGLEHAWMALQSHNAMGTDLAADIPWMVDIVRFFDSFYRAQTKSRTQKELGEDGKLVLYPLSGLELIGGGTNTIETVAGLRRVTEGLLALTTISATDRDFLTGVRKTLPELPLMERAGKKVLAPAVKWEHEYNPWEFPEMAAVWPYRFVGTTRPDTIQLGRDTWATVPIRGDNRSELFCRNHDFSWQSLGAFTAGLQMPEVKALMISKLSDAAGCARYPAYFGPGHDWMPDHNWGGSAMINLQEMLVQSDPDTNGKIHILPAWPGEWNVRFKLHTYGSTTVEGEVKDGKLCNLLVTPESRRKDVVIHDPIEQPPPPPVPVSQGKPASASSTFKPGFEPALAVDGDAATRWASAYEARQGWLQVDLGAEKLIKRAVVSEIEWPETREFAIECLIGDTWKEVARGSTIGPDKSIEFPPVRARIFRLNILKSVMAININEFQLFE